MKFAPLEKSGSLPDRGRAFPKRVGKGGWGRSENPKMGKGPGWSWEKEPRHTKNEILTGRGEKKRGEKERQKKPQKKARRNGVRIMRGKKERRGGRRRDERFDKKNALNGRGS